MKLIRKAKKKDSWTTNKFYIYLHDTCKVPGDSHPKWAELDTSSSETFCDAMVSVIDNISASNPSLG